MDLSQQINTSNVSQNPFSNISFIKFDILFDKVYIFFYNLFDPSYHIPYVGSGIKIIFSILSIFFIFIIFYTLIRLFEIRKREHEHIHHETEEYAHKHSEAEKEKFENGGAFLNKKWENVLKYLFSSSSGDWKLAIIEADRMLEDLMDQLGFKGENLGEKLKSTDQEKFKNLSSAWEVHIIRNKIAHEGSDFEVSQHEAKRVIALYEQIFRDYGFI